jgi:sterol desaturase/sphingolipid hydroxylase (fatty acid hydroxylase superfamily)
MVNYAASFLGLLVLVLLEQGWLRRRRGRPVDWLNLAANLHSGHLLMWLLRGVEVAAYAAVLHHASVGWAGHWPVAVQWIVGFVGWDLAFYAMHRAHHAVPLLWRVHAVHHQGTEMSLSLAIRNSDYSSLTDFPFMLPLAVVGVPLEVFLVVSAIHYFVQFCNHVDRDVVGRLPWLDRFFVTPSNHRSHHGWQPVYHNKNFGGTFLLWDKLFGTYQPELPDLPARYGLKTDPPGSNPLVMNHPRLAALFARARRTDVPPAYVGWGSVLLFCLVAFSVHRGAGPGHVLLTTGIILGSIVLGAAGDRIRAALVLWLAAGPAMLAWACVFTPDAPAIGLALALLAHSLAALRLLARPAAAAPTPSSPA